MLVLLYHLVCHLEYMFHAKLIETLSYTESRLWMESFTKIKHVLVPSVPTINDTLLARSSFGCSC